MDIYVLSDRCFPDHVRYVGKSVDAEMRFRRHLYDRKGHEHRKNWIRSVVAAGRRIEYRVIAQAETNREASELERRYITMFRAAGHDLTNTTDGGEGVVCYQYSEEQKRAIGERSRASWEAGAHTPESIEKTAAAHRGMKRSKETCRKISKALKGKPRGPFTEEHKKKIGAAQRRIKKPWTAALNKEPWSDERRAAQSAAQLRRWARKRAGEAGAGG